MRLKHYMLISVTAIAALVPAMGWMVVKNGQAIAEYESANADALPSVMALTAARSSLGQVLSDLEVELGGSVKQEHASHSLGEMRRQLSRSCGAYLGLSTASDDLPFQTDLRLALENFSSTTDLALQIAAQSAGTGLLAQVRLAGARLDASIKRAIEKELGELHESRAETLALTGHTRTLGLVLTLAALGATIGVGWTMSRTLGKGIARLQDLAARYAREEFDAPVETTGASEFRELGASMAAMALALAQSRAQLEGAREEAEQANTAKSEFLANMSHEIRTPMTAILGYAELLEDPGQDRAERAESARVIRRNGEHLLQIINDLLDLSKIEAGRMQLDDAPCSLCHVVSEVAALMRVRAMSKGLSLQVHYVFPVPEHVRTDPLRVKQVLVNLVGNAIKFTEVGEVQMIVRSQDLSGPAPLIGIEVIDTGIGMDSTQMLGLFQQFSQVDGSASRRFGGTGLGLVISRRIARMLGGDITVMSRPGRGSAFTFTFNPGDLTGQRLITSPSEAVAEPGSAEEQSDQPVHGRILLVEDGPDNQRLIAFLLRKAGADVEIAEDGQAALERVAAAALAGNPYQLILMDMQMPRMDGYTATKELRQRGVHAPIVALTAHAMSTDRERCLAAGCTDYLSKPIQRGCLLAMCARHIGGNSRLPQAA